MPRIKAIIVMDDTIGCFRVKCPFNKHWVEELKAKLPGGARTWDKPNLQWVFDPLFLDDVKELCDKFFGTPGIKDSGWIEHKPTTAPLQVTNNSEYIHYKTFVDCIPSDILKRMYYAAVKVHHPDTGGNATVAANLTVAWKYICEHHKL